LFIGFYFTFCSNFTIRKSKTNKFPPNIYGINSVLAEKLNMRYSEAELWIMNLVKSLKLDAKIDSVSGTLIMRVNRVDV
jgi:hypothetical protein